MTRLDKRGKFGGRGALQRARGGLDDCDGAAEGPGAEAPQGAIREQPKRNRAKKKDPDFENGSDDDFNPENETGRNKR